MDRHIPPDLSPPSLKCPHPPLLQICDMISSEFQCAVAVSDDTPLQKRSPKPSIRVTVSSGHTPAQIARFATALKKAATAVLQR